MGTREEKEERRSADSTRKTEKKKKETEDQARKRKDKENQQKMLNRAAIIPPSEYSARNIQNIFNGEQIVHDLKNSNDELGRMEHPCKFCGALKWKKETASLCCNSGKVILEHFPDPPELLKKLLTEHTEESMIFRRNTRPLNNALTLSSLQVHIKSFESGFAPNIIFEGKVCQRIGPLIPEPGEVPKFAQLYVIDSDTQHTTRVQNMNLPASLSKREIEVTKNLLKKLQQMLKDVNPFVKDLLHICEIPDDELLQGKLILSCKERPIGSHERTYNIPNSLSEISVLTNSMPGDLVLHKRGGGLQEIYDIHPSAQPLHFILLFPFGTRGYDESLKHQPNQVKRVSPREFFAFHINMRCLKSDYIFRFGRLFQEYLCLAFTTMESQRLKFQKNNQNSLRADSYKNVRDLVADRVPMTDKVTSDDHNLRIGRRIILSSSYVGSPRWYNAKFQDGMAICRKYRKPDLFITFTCNPKWEEITRELRKGESVQDRPDLVARVFKLKKDQLIRDMRYGRVFGKVNAFLWVIEFQKRGLPHAHILLILDDPDRLSTSSEVDKVISAQLPPDPNLLEQGSKEREQAERLESIVLKNMIHGPCGKLNPKSPCMQDGKCSKGYPKQFCDKTIINSDKTYPEYQRKSPEKDGRLIKLKNMDIDNSWVVPYSPFLALKYDGHINTEVCVSYVAPKYLFKYFTKGQDRVMARTEIEIDNPQPVDEIKDYIDLRSVGSSEASWHLLNFNISQNKPSVHALRVHLEDEQQIVFDMGSEQQSLEKQRCTELTEFFKYNRNNPGTTITYVDFPEKMTWNSREKEWKRRKSISDTIGRVHSIHPVSGEVYYLRMLLHNEHSMGKTSFTDLKTINGISRSVQSFGSTTR